MEISAERLEEALRLRQTDPRGWAQLHPVIRDQATIVDDIRESRRRIAERDAERAARGIS